MSALYLSISADHASSLPARHSLTRRVSSSTKGDFFGVFVITGVTGQSSPLRCAERVARRSTEHTVPEPRDENCRWCSLRRPGCVAGQENHRLIFGKNFLH